MVVVVAVGMGTAAVVVCRSKAVKCGARQSRMVLVVASRRVARTSGRLSCGQSTAVRLQQTHASGPEAIAAAAAETAALVAVLQHSSPADGGSEQVLCLCGDVVVAGVGRRLLHSLRHLTFCLFVCLLVCCLIVFP